jgi:hypothetical protein
LQAHRQSDRFLAASGVPNQLPLPTRGALSVLTDQV